MRDTGEFMTGMVLGAILGLATGLLLTPDVRRESSQHLSQWGQRARATSDDIVDRFRDQLRRIKTAATDGEAEDPPLQY